MKRNTLPLGDSIDIEFKGSLRPHQIPAVNSDIDYCAEKGHACGLLELDCAAGKTVLSLNLIARLKLKTLMIVNKEFLLNQWVERITEFLPTARIGRIQGSIVSVENKDIVIGMLQSLLSDHLILSRYVCSNIVANIVSNIYMYVMRHVRT